MHAYVVHPAKDGTCLVVFGRQIGAEFVPARFKLSRTYKTRGAADKAGARWVKSEQPQPSENPTMNAHQTAVETARGRAEMAPLPVAAEYLAHLLKSLQWQEDTYARTGQHLRIDPDEARAVAEVVEKVAKRDPTPPVPPVNHPVLAALRWIMSQHSDAACMFGQSKHRPTECDACNAKWILDCIEDGGHPQRVALWVAKHPDLVPVTLAGLAP